MKTIRILESTHEKLIELKKQTGLTLGYIMSILVSNATPKIIHKVALKVINATNLAPIKATFDNKNYQSDIEPVGVPYLTEDE